VHLTDDSQEVVVRLPVLQLIVHIDIAFVLRDFVVQNAVHDVYNWCHLRELNRDHNFDEKRLLTLG